MKVILTLIFLTVIGSCALAQGNGEKRQEIENIKLAFISTKLDLNTEEAQHFWPIYNTYRSDFSEIIKLKRESKRNQLANADQQLDREIDFDERILELKKRYRLEFSKAIPPAKVLLFFEAEREFRERLIKQLRERRRQDN